MDIDHKEFPADWFEGLAPEKYRGRKYTTAHNKYGVRHVVLEHRLHVRGGAVGCEHSMPKIPCMFFQVNAGQNQAAWEEKGWIKPELDPRGWFHW